MITIIHSGASKEKIQSILENRKKNRLKKVIDLKKYCGVVKLKSDPVSIQKSLRDEWR